LKKPRYTNYETSVPGRRASNSSLKLVRIRRRGVRSDDAGRRLAVWRRLFRCWVTGSGEGRGNTLADRRILRPLALIAQRRTIQPYQSACVPLTQPEVLHHPAHRLSLHDMLLTIRSGPRYQIPGISTDAIRRRHSLLPGAGRARHRGRVHAGDAP
jgi:hypothetical protein